MQVQFHKANVEVHEVKDHLLSTMPIRVGAQLQKGLSPGHSSVITIDGEENIEEAYLPNPIHPYDHFIVAGFI